MPPDLGILAPERMADQEPFFGLEAYPATKRALVTQEALSVDADDQRQTRPRWRCCVARATAVS